MLYNRDFDRFVYHTWDKSSVLLLRPRVFVRGSIRETRQAGLIVTLF
jgi:hypothetical protein